MDEKTRKLVADALAEYGADLTEEGFIRSNGKPSRIKVCALRGRLRIESDAGQLMASGPIAAQTIRSFVESFWFWTKKA